MFVTLLLADIVVVIFAAIFLPPPWNWGVAGGVLILVACVVWVLARPLRTRHRLGDQSLQINYGKVRLNIARDRILGVRAHSERVPPKVRLPGVSYIAETDRLYVLSDNRRLVEIDLAEPFEGMTDRNEPVQFTRLLLSVDQPDSLIAALAGA